MSLNRKKILITAGGTATAWHICTVIRNHFNDDFEIHICDTNPQELVPASIYAFKYHQVPAIKDTGYCEHMFSLLEKYDIDIIIPLIDDDLYLFSSDNKDLLRLNVVSTAPPLKTIDTLSNKDKMFNFLQEHNIPTPKLYAIEQVEPLKNYVLKSAVGFGSRSLRLVEGSQLHSYLKKDDIIQEICNGDTYEVTAEVYHDKNHLEIFSRQRIETKSGVCTKMKPIYSDEIICAISKLVSLLTFPRAFCVQFMMHNDHWNIIDCNLRLGAGTAMSTAIGFQLTRALLASLLELEISSDYFIINSNIKSVLRVYSEVLIP